MITKYSQDEIIGYLEDSSNFQGGKAEVLYIPENEDEVIAAVEECTKNGVKSPTPLTVSAGGTGTVGARIPVGGAILSTERLNRIISIDGDRKTARLESGVMVDNFLKELDRRGLFYPPFPTERTAFIGGNISTNASGEYSYRFGSTRRYVKAIRVVLSTGEVLEIPRGKYCANLSGYIEVPRAEKGEQKIGCVPIKIPAYTSPTIKNSAGYFSQPGMDLVDLFVGSEGTLGVITEAEVKLISALPPRFILIFFLSDEKELTEFLALIKSGRSVNPLSLEYFDRGSLNFLKKDFPGIPKCECALYVEDEESEKSLNAWIELAEGQNIIDTWISKDEKSYREFIDFRHKLPENINEHFKKMGLTKLAIDASVPEKVFPEFFALYRKIQEETAIQTVRFGHIGENHIHFNFFPRDEREKQEVAEIFGHVLQRVVKQGGTVSAEHGIGKLKHRYLEIMYGKEGILEMARVKKKIDPHCIFGLDNIFPKAYLD